MTYLLFSCGIALSAVAAYYSVMGLIAIFSTAVIPIAIMGSVLEVSKLVSASWLYRNWKTIPTLLKVYFTTAVVVLMLLTSMGIFGYLSKAHLDQAVPTGDVASKVAILDEKIKSQKENVDAARKAITQLDAQVDQTLSRTTDDRGAANAVAIRQRQAKERAILFAEIGKSQAEIAKLNEERAPIASELRKVEAEVGPIKYIAALIYGDTIDDTILEKSVRIVILLIVFVFDPLAVLLLIAANSETLKRPTEEEPEEEKVVWGGIDHTRLSTDSDEDEDEDSDLPQYPTVEVQTNPPTWIVSNEPIENNEAVWKSVVDNLMPKEEEAKWEIPPPPAKPPAEFTKVVHDYFHENDKPEVEEFTLSADFDEKDAFLEKPLVPVRKNSRRTPEA